MSSFASFFEYATGHAPYPYQERLADGAPALLEIPTGLGKTEATVLSWLYRRTQAPEQVPRRLFYCLPMRSLVEQTRDRICSCFERLGANGYATPSVEVVMGADVGEQWFREPEKPAVIIGTQDMLLSRALNRGYGMSRFQWPMTFAAANEDAYWVIDEVQLQGIGAVTAAQLQAFRERLGGFYRSELTLASATIDETWFETADFSLADRHRVGLGDEDLSNPALRRIASADKVIERADAFDAKDVAALVRNRHVPGTRTLVVLNRVARAQEVYRHLQRGDTKAELVLLHSRFRPPERANHARELLADVHDEGRIAIATQVVEAGIDVSAATLITDVAPWSSLVQRFGRCNRRGTEQNASCIWLDGGEPKKNDARPYEMDDLLSSRDVLQELEGASAAPLALPKRPIALRRGLVIRRPEFLDLFDTSRDLAGHDVDVSPYIRDADDVSVSVFWREESPDATDLPQRDELCSAPISDIRDLAKSLRKDGHGADIRIANQFAKDAGDCWTELHDSEVRPGIVVWLRSDVGYYDNDMGFCKVRQNVAPVGREPISELSESCPVSGADPLSEIGKAVTLTQHARDTERHARALVAGLGIPSAAAESIVTAALWHDVGKAHEVFQNTMRRANKDVGDSPIVWAKGVHRAKHERPGFRHELPGALIYLQAHGRQSDADTVAYLIAAHHGKFRLTAQQFPYETPREPFQLLGNRSGDVVPATDLGEGLMSPSLTISLAPFAVGQADGGRSWAERTMALRDDPLIGPFRLAYMELIVRLADWRASAEERQ